MNFKKSGFFYSLNVLVNGGPMAVDDDTALAGRRFDFELDGDFRKPRLKQSHDAIYYGAVSYRTQRPPLRG